MKLNRRNSIMAIIGGIAGVPQAAKAVMETKFNLMPPSAGIPAYDYTSKSETLGAKIDQEQYVGARIKQLQKVINGDFEEWQQDQLIIGNHEEELYYTEIDSLKSVSPVNKRILVNNARVKAQKKRWIKDAQKELESILKHCTFLDKLGIKL